MKPLIAVVEDNEDNRVLLQALLEPRYRIDVYTSGFEALRGVEAARPDLLLLDISLPEMDGLELLEKLRQGGLPRSVPAIALTAHAMAGDRERFLESGFDDYVSKPIVDAQVLYAAIERLLGASEPPREEAR